MSDIQRLTKDDIREQAAVHVLSFRAAYKGIIPDDFLDQFTVEQREAFFLKEYEICKDTYVIREYKKIIGFSTISSSRDEDKDETTGEVRGIYIHPEYWRKGYGGTLFDYVVSELVKRRYSEITLWVLDDNSAARAFYEKKGFAFDGRKKIMEIGKPLTEIRYSFRPGETR